MDIDKVCWKIFNAIGVKNVFYPIEELSNPEVQPWISKSKHELNRFAKYIISLNTFNRTKPDNHTCQAIHESLNSCSVSIVFSLFNIFAILSKTRASFFDTSIRDYFMEKVRLSFEDSYLLSFFWHETVLSMNSLGYSPDQHLKICLSNDCIGFIVTELIDGKSNSEIDQNEAQEITNSTNYYAYHLLQLLSVIDLVANLLNPGITSPGNSSSFLQIENYPDLYSIYEKILKQTETAT